MKTSKEATDVFADDRVPAEGWASAEACRGSQTATSQELADSVAVFLALGGQIQQIPMGKTAITEEALGSPSDMMGKVAVGLLTKFELQDKASCARLRAEMARNPGITLHGLRQILKVSPQVVKRLLLKYFADDEQAQQIIAAHVRKNPALRGQPA